MQSSLTFDSMDRTLKCDHSLESCWAAVVLSIELKLRKLFITQYFTLEVKGWWFCIQVVLWFKSITCLFTTNLHGLPAEVLGLLIPAILLLPKWNIHPTGQSNALQELCNTIEVIVMQRLWRWIVAIFWDENMLVVKVHIRRNLTIQVPVMLSVSHRLPRKVRLPTVTGIVYYNSLEDGWSVLIIQRPFRQEASLASVGIQREQFKNETSVLGGQICQVSKGEREDWRVASVQFMG